MLETEFNRQKRERDFQARVLSAVEKSKGNRLWTILNSSFVLWLLSAILLTVGGTYFSTHQQCIREAENFIVRRGRIVHEIYIRALERHRVVEKATTFQEAIAAFQSRSTGKFEFAEFSLHSDYELERELDQMEERFRLPNVPALVSRSLPLAMQFFGMSDNSAFNEYKLMTVKNESEVRMRRAYSAEMASLLFRSAPECSLRNTLSFALSEKPKYVVTTMSDDPAVKAVTDSFIKSIVARQGAIDATNRFMDIWLEKLNWNRKEHVDKDPDTNSDTAR